MTTLTRDQILNAADYQRHVEPVPEWGGDVILRSPNLADRDAYVARLLGSTGPLAVGHRAQLVAVCVIDEDGARVFSDADIEALAAKDAAVIDRLFEACQKLAGLAQHAPEETIKNSAASPIGVSVSG
jgi:hypothetical protein